MFTNMLELGAEDNEIRIRLCSSTVSFIVGTIN